MSNASVHPNAAFGIDIITAIDPNAEVNYLDEYIQVIVDDTLSNFSESDETALSALGWKRDDREVWLFYYDGDQSDELC